ncbi:MAG: ATP-dependent DNA helicase [Butyrivibrio sp.]|nr:ATP-dependent DNA helicase [Butyrivibrio sp.]
MFDITDGQLKISVRTLVEFLCRSGDIDNRFGGVPDKTAMEAGSRAHRRIQKSMGADYKAEVPLKWSGDGESYQILVEGRADGIFASDGIFYIDEIKGTYRDIKYLTEPVYVHKAQAMCYAFFYMLDNGIKDRIGIRMTYVSLDSDDVRYFEEILGFEELKAWFEELIGQLSRWGDYLCEHLAERARSVKGLRFPFEYRKGQRELAVNVYRAIGMRCNLFIQAPTGVGKTISTVYPAVMSLGNGGSGKIFYLTAKTITRTAAEEAFSLLQARGLKFKTVTITAKEKICLLDSETGPECNPVSCPYAKGHNDRVNEAVYDLITHENFVSRQALEEYAAKHRVCPFELCLDVSYWVDGIICDYNYVFDPHVYLKRYFAEGRAAEHIFLIDEAHNLVDRAREMYSAHMFKEDFLSVKKLVKGHSGELVRALERCNANLLELKRGCDGAYAVLESDGAFALNMQRLGEEIVKFTESHRDFAYMRELSEFYFDVLHYNGIRDCLDENYIIYTEHTDSGFMLRLFCVNPSKNLKTCLQKGRAAVFFSATLLPVNYYKELLSGDKEDYAVYARSPFDAHKRLLLVGRDVSSRYTRRNEIEYAKIVRYIEETVSGREGNYLVFFPSYKYMEEVYALMLREGANAFEVKLQSRDMSEREKELFLESFGRADGGSLVGFCVMGGVFSEGIDLKKDSLIGAVIVGTGLPSINTAGQLLRRYYDEKEGCGYEYAYVYPGMNKVLQAAGRVIRTDEDRGVIALLDDRFLTPAYLSLFPAEWSEYSAVTAETVKQEVLDFWDGK